MTLISLKKIVSYTFLISKTKDFGVKITFGFKITLLKKRIAKARPFHGKARWSVNCSYFSQFEIIVKEMLEGISYAILEL